MSGAWLRPLPLLLALFALAAAQPLQLGLCDYSAGGAASQLWTHEATSNHLSLLHAPGLCVMLSSGCCSGELVRGGDIASLQPCEAAYQSQMFGFPSSSFPGAPNAIPSLASGGEPGVSPTASGAPLVLDAAGYAWPGAPVLLRAYTGPADSAFAVNGSASSGARLVHVASGLCLAAPSAAAPPARSPGLSLQPCAAARQVPGPAPFFSSQLFAAAAGGLVNSRGLCVTAERVAGAALALPGEVRLVGISCAAGGGAAAQALALLPNGTIAAPALGLVADAGAGAWWGAPVFLSAAAGAPSAAFAWAAAPGNASALVITHRASGLCLDAAGVPEGHGCLHASVRGLPYCDAAQPLAARVADLVSRLTPAEAYGFLGAGETPAPCSTINAPVPRLDVPPMRQLVEVTSMMSGTCDSRPYAAGGATGCFTAFPAGMVLGAAFNRSLWQAHGVVVSNEMRALNNIGAWTGYDAAEADLSAFVTLSGHGPNVNQPRDPRNGRNGELIGEDPLLAGRVAEHYVRGLQFGLAPQANYTGPLRMLASLKHYTAYSLETNRMSSTGNVSMRELWETYLPAFERPMTHAAAAGTMCSYFSARIGASSEYVPSCASEYLLSSVVREFWGRPDATHLTDCGATWNMAYENHYVGNLTAAAAAGINAGLDMNSNTISPTHMAAAVAAGLVAPSTVLAAAGRVLAQRFRVGHFDALEATPPALLALGAADIGAAASAAVAADGTAQGLVLLRNDAGALPLAAGRRLAVLGPQAASYDALLGDPYGSGYCDEGSACFPSLAAALAAANAGGATVTFPGVQVKANDSSWGAALAAVADADAVVLALGTDRSVAAEGRDRDDGIGLPGLQGAFGVAVLRAAAARRTPVILLLLHNLPVSFEELVQPAAAGYAPVAAIVDAWAPTTHADVVAAALFGRVNRWGKATLTVYPAAYAQAISLFEFSMSRAPGRSYKYYDGSAGAPLVRFGQGMSYSTFAVACAGGLDAGGTALDVACNVSNTAGPDGDEVLMLFHRPSAQVVARVAGAHALPLAHLVGFERVAVGAGAAAPVALHADAAEALAFVDEDGASVLYPGLHYIDVSNGNGVNITISVMLEMDAPRVVRAPPAPTR